MDWEYVAHAVDTRGFLFDAGGFDPRAMTQMLNEYGAQKWELISAFSTAESCGLVSQLGLIFRRPRAAVAVTAVQT